ncbi:hypothetical protein [Streptomyces sp. NPDC058657]
MTQDTDSATLARALLPDALRDDNPWRRPRRTDGRRRAAGRGR